MRKTLTRIISIMLIVAFSSSNLSYGLATLPASQNPEVKRKIYALLAKQDIRFADTDDARKLLEINGDARGLLLSSGKYLFSSELAGDDVDVLELLRVMVHEDVEALLQILAYENRAKYRSLRDVILDAFPPEGEVSSLDLYVNHLIAAAFEWLWLLADGYVREEDVPESIVPFLERITPIILEKKHTIFTAEYWDMHKRRERIQRARNEGVRFYQVAGERDTSASNTNEASPDNEPLDISEIIKFHNKFKLLVKVNEIGKDSPEGYRVSLREIIHVAEFILQHRSKLGPKAALTWALREIYFRRLHSKEDREKILGLNFSRLMEQR